MRAAAFKVVAEPPNRPTTKIQPCIITNNLGLLSQKK
jgi:hypothetical protein